jgi:serine/threonine protein kinase
MLWNQGYKLQNGRLVIDRQLGQGGFGITYKALHTGFNAPVVIKTPNAFLRNDPEYPKYVNRFIREAQILAKLENNPHPHIVRVKDLFEEKFGTETAHCLVMEFIEGKNLFELVKEQGRLSETNALGLICPIAEALGQFHGLGAVHRDVTPVNIMIRNSNNRSVLIDFGLAGDIVPVSMSSKMFGNRAFAPYEQLIKGDRSPQVDIYTLAASLYYAVTGQLPTDCFSRKVEDEELVPPQDLASVSGNLNEAILWAMALKSVDRPPSMLAWLQKLQTSEKPTPPRYRQLEVLLAAGKWEEADQETEKVMLEVANRTKEGWLNVVSIDDFPCEDLWAIDGLWVKYSKGRFGFSVQKRIYQSLGGTREYNSEVGNSFADQVGWKKEGSWVSYSELNFSNKAPEGHLPRLTGLIAREGLGFVYWGVVEGGFSSLASRLIKCNI